MVLCVTKVTATRPYGDMCRGHLYETDLLAINNVFECDKFDHKAHNVKYEGATKRYFSCDSDIIIIVDHFLCGG